MSELFSAQRRDDVLERLLLFLKADDTIAGAVRVGSGAKDFQDVYSGIDLLIAVANDAVFSSVYRKWKDRICTLFPVAYQFEQHVSHDTGHISVMLDDYLELDLTFTQVQILKVTRDPWHVLFDQTETGDIDAILQATYDREISNAPARIYRAMISSIWQPIIKCVAALNRGETWRALHMLERIRQQLVELAAMRYHLDTRHYAEVDQLPEMLLVQMRHTLPTSTDAIAIRRALRKATSLFFEQAHQLEEETGLDLADDLQARMMLFIEAYA